MQHRSTKCRIAVQKWNYKVEADTVKHIGPTAQEFYAAFGVDDDKSIAGMDRSAVAFLAIQALHAENEQLRERIERLERLVDGQAGGE